MRILIICLLIFFYCEPGLALRCTNTGKIIDIGNTKSEVLKWCGEPKSKEVIGEKGKFTDDSGKSFYRSIFLEVWILDASQNADHLDYRLLFKGDQLIEIEHIR